MAEVVMKDVTKIFDKGVVAVKDANIEVKDEEFMVLVGPSGCGKSTTLRMIAGLEEPTSGEVYIDRKMVNNVPPKDRDIAMVFQNYALYPHMTVYENMAFGLKLRRFPKLEIQQRVREAADILGIQGLLDRRPKALSGGQRQRVAVGRAIVRKPKVFLFDEPLSNLDAKLRVQMRTEISKLHNRLKATMVYVTHDQVEAMTMGDRIVVMKDGIIHQIDGPMGLYNHPVNKFVAGFIGSPTMNFFDGQIVDHIFKADGISVAIPEEFWERLSGRSKVILGIRPENICDARFADRITHRAKVLAEVEVSELMGHEILLYLHSGSLPFVARMDVKVDARVGDKLNLVFDMGKAHFFDPETEETL